MEAGVVGAGLGLGVGVGLGAGVGVTGEGATARAGGEACVRRGMAASLDSGALGAGGRACRLLRECPPLLPGCPPLPACLACL